MSQQIKIIDVNDIIKESIAENKAKINCLDNVKGLLPEDLIEEKQLIIFENILKKLINIKKKFKKLYQIILKKLILLNYYSQRRSNKGFKCQRNTTFFYG